MSLLTVCPYDREVYEHQLKDFLPDVIVDCHTHIWLTSHDQGGTTQKDRSCAWPSMVAKDNSIEDLMETNRLLFPGKQVRSVLYGQPMATIHLPTNNAYVAHCAEKYGFPALYLSHPMQSAEEVECAVLANPCYKGLKVYLQFAPAYIPSAEIRIFDFLPPHHLALADRYGWVVQLHIARPKRLADPVNYVQLREIEERYPHVKLIVAHLGRAYADEDVGNALEYLKDTKQLLWDFTANTNANVMYQILERFGPERMLYGSDFPIFRMKARRVVEHGFYINEIPRNSLGDVSADPHMREVDNAENITFFIYEEMLACRNACEKLGLKQNDVEKIFCRNSERVFEMSNDQ